jgi:hypothetical protein
MVSQVDGTSKTMVIHKLKFGTWNVRDLMGKQQELKKKHTAVITETKNKGTQEWED